MLRRQTVLVRERDSRCADRKKTQFRLQKVSCGEEE